VTRHCRRRPFVADGRSPSRRLEEPIETGDSLSRRTIGGGRVARNPPAAPPELAGDVNQRVEASQVDERDVSQIDHDVAVTGLDCQHQFGSQQRCGNRVDLAGRVHDTVVTDRRLKTLQVTTFVSLPNSSKAAHPLDLAPYGQHYLEPHLVDPPSPPEPPPGASSVPRCDCGRPGRPASRCANLTMGGPVPTAPVPPLGVPAGTGSPSVRARRPLRFPGRSRYRRFGPSTAEGLDHGRVHGTPTVVEREAGSGG
jgi:hypothetical protein